MAKDIKITVENKLVAEKRDMNVYHNSTRSAHMISYNSSVTLPLKPVIEDDYLHVSVVIGPGHLENTSVVNLPSWADFEFSSEKNVTITHSGERTLLKIPPGLPMWQLRITRPISRIDSSTDHVTIGDDLTGYR